LDRVASYAGFVALIVFDNVVALLLIVGATAIPGVFLSLYLFKDYDFRMFSDRDYWPFDKWLGNPEQKQSNSEKTASPMEVDEPDRPTDS